MLTNNFSVALGAASQAMQQTRDRRYDDDYGYYYDHSNDTLSHVSVFVKLAAHF